MSIEGRNERLVSLLLVFLSENYGVQKGHPCELCGDVNTFESATFNINGKETCVRCVLDRVEEQNKESIAVPKSEDRLKLMSLLLVFLTENYKCEYKSCDECGTKTPRFERSFEIGDSWVCTDCIIERIDVSRFRQRKDGSGWKI